MPSWTFLCKCGRTYEQLEARTVCIALDHKLKNITYLSGLSADRLKPKTFNKFRGETNNMSDSVLTSLLQTLPRGEEIKDQREGDYPEAILQGAELVRNSTGSFAIVAQYGNLRDADGRAFEHKERYNIPERTSDVAVKRIFLSVLHDHTILDRTSKTAIYAETDEQRQSLLEAFETVKGTVVPLRLRARVDNGFMRASRLNIKK